MIIKINASNVFIIFLQRCYTVGPSLMYTWENVWKIFFTLFSKSMPKTFWQPRMEPDLTCYPNSSLPSEVSNPNEVCFFPWKSNSLANKKFLIPTWKNWFCSKWKWAFIIMIRFYLLLIILFFFIFILDSTSFYFSCSGRFL